MGNATWACFDCREAVRRPTHYAEAVPCPRCGLECVCLGTKIRIPARSDEKAWQDLRAWLRDNRHAALERAERMRVFRRHSLEQQIAALEVRSPNDGRKRALQQLRKQLESLSSLPASPTGQQTD